MNTHSILVVDDDVDACENLSDILTDFGFDVEVAHNGHEALRMVRDRAYDLALLDFKMPSMDGLTLYRQMRQLSPGIVAMMVTAYATTDTRQAALDAGTWRVLSKPVNFGELLPLLEEAVGQPSVMLIDDDQSLCDNLWELLRQRGYRVSIASDEKEARRRLGERTNYRVVLVDLKLPDADGREILARVRETHPHTRTVLVSGHVDDLEQVFQDVQDRKADAVLHKPFNVPELLATIDKLAGRLENGSA